MTIKADIVLAGVGGQGVLSIASIIAAAAMAEKLHVKQGEVHGMSQRGGAVQASLRVSDEPIHSDLVPQGTAALILSLEPVESLRYLPWLSPTGTVATSLDPVLNITNYPQIEEVVGSLSAIPRVIMIEADRLAKSCGSSKTSNVVMVGACAHLLPMRPETIEDMIRMLFERKGEKMVDINLRAFEAGREAGQCAKT